MTIADTPYGNKVVVPIVSGSQGSQGAPGPQGPPDGAQGSQGTQGSQGVKGDTGAGPPGSQGSQGTQGAQGTNGVVASVVAGTGIAVDDTDPANPVVAASGGSGSLPIGDPTNVTFPQSYTSPTSGNAETVVTVGENYPDYYNDLLVLAQEGDDFPRFLLKAFRMYFGDGTFDPEQGTQLDNSLLQFTAGATFGIAGADNLSVINLGPDGVSIQIAPTQALGFFGATPVTQPAAPILLSDVITALQALGLVGT